MRLSPPKGIIFLISLILVVVGALMHFGIIAYFAQYAFILVLIGYVLLALGCLFKNV